MPNYIYICKDCVSKHNPQELEEMSQDEFGASVLFETFHSMEPSEEELQESVICPRCKGKNCEKHYAGTAIHSYMRGYGWKDYSGARRDMDRYHLTNQDKYSEHRVTGEQDHINTKLVNQGKHNPKPKHFLT